MKKIELSAIEKEMANFDFNELTNHVEGTKSSIATARSAEDVKAKICAVWKKIRRFVILAEAVPIVGKFIKILADLLDSLCSVE
ncbi:MAG: hypothetical protein IPJ79_01160 [Bacteroidetes bacterium]|nr:hypothetical protein [Bacteroidota bacterium]